MAPDDFRTSDPNTRRGCQFTLLAIFVVTTVVAVITAALAGGFGERLLGVACIFWPGTLFILYCVWPLVIRRRP